MKKIIISLAIIMAVGSAGFMATQAYFSSEATVTASTFTAGTMDLKIDQNPSGDVYSWVTTFAAPDNFVTNLYPGYPAKSEHNWQILDLKNEGNLDGNVTIKFHITSSQNELPANLIFTVSYDSNHDGTFETPVASGPLSDWNDKDYTMGAITGDNADSGNDPSGKLASVKIEWSVPTSAGNDIQGDSVTIDTIFGLKQVE